MERHSDRSTIVGPVAGLIASLSQGSDATNAALLLPTADELRQPIPKVTVKDEPTFKPK
jgi:hypothetical protein